MMKTFELLENGTAAGEQQGKLSRVETIFMDEK